jgi:hypothetical protein
MPSGGGVTAQQKNRAVLKICIAGIINQNQKQSKSKTIKINQQKPKKFARSPSPHKMNNAAALGLARL